jgi:predicted Fe-Mo cluster-binding NifX family protein
MRIAISTDGDLVSAHFGRCPDFTIVDVVNGKTVHKEVLPNPGHEPGVIPQFLHGRPCRRVI